MMPHLIPALLLVVGAFQTSVTDIDDGADFRGNYLYFDEIGLFRSSTAVNEERAYHHHAEAEGDVGRYAAMKGARIYIRCVID